MDVFNTVAICLHQIRVVTIYIHRVVKSYRKYEKSHITIRTKLEHEMAFIEAFIDIYLGPEKPLLKQAETRDNLVQDIKRILQGLRRSLLEFQNDGIKHGFYTTEDLIIKHEYAQDALPAQSVVQISGFRKAFTDKIIRKMEEKLQTLRANTPVKIDWALYSEARMIELLTEYRNWTLFLREDLALLGTLGIRPPPTAANVSNLGLQMLFEKQRKAAREVSETFTSLTGHLVTQNDQNQSSVFVTIYEDQFELVKESVLAEVRPYSDELRALMDNDDADDSERIEELKRPLRELAWFLNDSLEQWERQQDSANAEDDQNISFDQASCLGFLDQPDRRRVVLLYRLPVPGLENTGSISTLFNILKRKDGSQRPWKPVLGARFLIAFRLASAILGVFASGWLHKNISSNGILISDTNKLFLIGWGTARKEEDSTTLYSADELSLQSNLYRHPDRYGKPKVRATQEHDIYSVGVVLLEIGLWEPIQGRFAKVIEECRQTGKLPPARSVASGVLKLAEGEKLRQEMGVRYAEVVQKCLKMSFVASDNDSSAQPVLAFRNQVIEKLKIGCTL